MTGPVSVGPVSASGIVLAGGRSSRFGRDKLAEPLSGRPLVHHAILALGAVCAEVVVVVPKEGSTPPVPADLAAPMRVVRDPEPFAGPLVGLAAGLERATEPIVLVVGGDMPALRHELLTAMLRQTTSGVEDAVALRYRGRVLPLPVALRNGAVAPVLDRLVGAGERSLRALLEVIPTRALEEPEWRPLDPTAASVLDVDRPEDLPVG